MSVSVSVVVPVFNGARSIPELAARLTRTLSDEQRVAEFGKEFEKLSSTPQTNDVPALVPDPPDAPKP